MPAKNWFSEDREWTDVIDVGSAVNLEVSRHGISPADHVKSIVAGKWGDEDFSRFVERFSYPVENDDGESIAKVAGAYYGYVEEHCLFGVSDNCAARSFWLISEAVDSFLPNDNIWRLNFCDLAVGASLLRSEMEAVEAVWRKGWRWRITASDLFQRIVSRERDVPHMGIIFRAHSYLSELAIDAKDELLAATHANRMQEIVGDKPKLKRRYNLYKAWYNAKRGDVEKSLKSLSAANYYQKGFPFHDGFINQVNGIERLLFSQLQGQRDTNLLASVGDFFHSKGWITDKSPAWKEVIALRRKPPLERPGGKQPKKRGSGSPLPVELEEPQPETEAAEIAVLNSAQQLDAKARRRLSVRLSTPLADEFHKKAFGHAKAVGTVEKVNEWWEGLKYQEKTRKERGLPPQRGRDTKQLLDTEKERAVEAMNYFSAYFNASIHFRRIGPHYDKVGYLSLGETDGTVKFLLNSTDSAEKPLYFAASRPELVLLENS